VLGQVKVDEKSNEIVAIPALLDMMSIEGAVVTIDLPLPRLPRSPRRRARRRSYAATVAAEYEKARLVAKLKAARDAKKAVTGKCGGRKTYAERDPALVQAAKELSAQRLLRFPMPTLRNMADVAGALDGLTNTRISRSHFPN
jgi:hypothetical protein